MAFIKKLEVGNYLFQNNTLGDESVVSEGVYYYGDYELFVNSEGLIITINNLTTGESQKLLSQKYNFFGGDTFIGRFSLKRKHSFFNNTAFQLPDYTHINYSDIPNVAYPTFFFNTQSNEKNNLLLPILDNIGDPIDLSLVDKKIKDYGTSFNKILDVFKDNLLNPNYYLKPPNYYLDCTSAEEANHFNINSIKGIIYTYYYGIPYFIVESDINLDLRESSNNEDKGFYPKQADLNYWLQEKTVSPKLDNSFEYDKSFSKQPTEKQHTLQDITFNGDKDFLTKKEQRIIYSPESIELETGTFSDKFLINKTLDFYDHGYKNGKLVGIQAVENNILLSRFEHNLEISNAYYQIETNQGVANLSVGKVFKNKPQQIVSSPTGFLGSISSSFLSTPFGHVLVDVVRGDVLLLNSKLQGLDNIGNNGLKNWLKQNLPFEIIKHFPDVKLDNSFSNLGISLGFDYKSNMLFITKHDYFPLGKITHKNGKFFNIQNEEISLLDKRYFRNKSFTVGYSFLHKEWIFYSFKPTGYLNYPEHFDTIVDNEIWKHGITNKSYLSFYGKTYPFIIDVKQKPKLQSEIIKNVSYKTEIVRYLNDQDFHYVKNKGFDYAIVYNDFQNSGLLELDYVDRSDLEKVSKYPIKLSNRSKIIVTQKEGWNSFNQFKNLVNNDEVLIWNYDPNNVNKQINPEAITNKETAEVNYIRGTNVHVRLISINTKEKITFKGILINGRDSRRTV